MERFSLITVILFFLSGCATEIIPTDLYHDEPKFDTQKINMYLRMFGKELISKILKLITVLIMKKTFI